MADVFLSYSRDDVERVRRLVQMIERGGLCVFWDHEIEPGAQWSEVLQREMDAAKVVVVVWSEVSVRSRWVQAEASAADQSGKMVPVRIDDVAPPMPFGMVQTFDLSNPFTGPAPEQVEMFNAKLASMTGKAGAGLSAAATTGSTFSSVMSGMGFWAGSAQANRVFVDADGDVMYAGFWRRFVAILIDYFVVGLVVFGVVAGLTTQFPNVMPQTRLSMPFGVLTSDKTLETKTSTRAGLDRATVTETDQVVERTVAGAWTYTLRIIRTETVPIPVPNDSAGSRPVKRVETKITRLDPESREERADHDLFKIAIGSLLLYGALMEASALQATLGKLAIGLRVTDKRGKRCSMWLAIQRNLFKIASVGTLGVGFAMAGWTKRKQALHDLIARCYVLQTR